MKLKELPPYCEYFPDFVQQSSGLFKELNKSINWRRDEIKMYGRSHLIPRHHAWYGDENAHYSYSGISLPINPWTSSLTKLKRLVELKAGTIFNGVLCNLYESGEHSNSWHADDERELVRPITVASISLGAKRDFQLRKRGSTWIEQKVALDCGSLFIMHSPFQEHWQHQIAKSKKVTEGRINLTFRKVIEQKR